MHEKIDIATHMRWGSHMRNYKDSHEVRETTSDCAFKKLYKLTWSEDSGRSMRQ